MATYSIKAIKYCEQSVPGPQMFFMARWDEWMTADFLLLCAAPRRWAGDPGGPGRARRR